MTIILPDGIPKLAPRNPNRRSLGQMMQMVQDMQATYIPYEVEVEDVRGDVHSGGPMCVHRAPFSPPFGLSVLCMRPAHHEGRHAKLHLRDGQQRRVEWD